MELPTGPPSGYQLNNKSQMLPPLPGMHNSSFSQPQLGNMFQPQPPPSINNYRAEKLLEKMREDKLMAILERQTEILSKMVAKYKIIEENTNRKLMDRIQQLEKENEMIIKKNREDYLLYHINENIDYKFRQFNEQQLQPYIDQGQPVYLRPLHLDYFDNQLKFKKAEEDLFGVPAPPPEKKKKKKKKKHKKSKNTDPDKPVEDPK